MSAVPTIPDSTERIPLLDWVAQRAPHLERFDYFAPYAHAIERSIGGNLRIAFAAPPQHGKSVLTLYALLWIATYYPGYSHAYVTYSQTRRTEVAKMFRALAASCGMACGGTLDVITLPGGTAIKFTSVRASLTGWTINGLCVIDDPISDEKDARSATLRGDIVRWWESSARTRRHEGTSYIVMATRWHVADLTGYLIENEGWEYLNFKAIAEPENGNGQDDIDEDGRIKSDPIHRRPGESLCPNRKPPEFFARERKSPYWWAAMYQGQPRPEGGALFREPTYYAVCPACGSPAALCGCSGQRPVGYRVGYGVDLAYTARTSANFSVSVEGWLTTDEKRDADGKPIHRLYIRDVHRKQVDAPSFTLTLKTQHMARRGPMRWYCATSEQGAGQFVKEEIPSFQIRLTTGDKFVRATPVAAAWNAGRVLVPSEAPEWLEDFLDEILAFTGQKDPTDDQVDSLAALWDVLTQGDGDHAPVTARTHRQ